MRRYFFDFRDGESVVTDEEGLELLTLDTVQEEAARALGQMARDELPLASNRQTRYMAIEVRDEDGPVLHVKFSFEMKRLQ